ncbi:MAG: LUD domain-containing protein [Flavobacteriaceae bacterium]
MSFFKKLFKLKSSQEEEAKEQEVHLSLDDAFVHHFIQKGGKFLYCISTQELKSNLNNILLENNWNKVICLSDSLKDIVDHSNVEIIADFNNTTPFLTNCEHLISDCGDILFSSNQIGSNKLASLTENFIVFAKTSQLVKNTGEGLTGIKANFKENIPTNISAVKNYQINIEDDNFLNYGNSNTKNLYLLLLEDL